MVGHNCGGLGKMPGFYFRAQLDNIQDMAHRQGPAGPPGQLSAYFRAHTLGQSRSPLCIPATLP